MRITVRGIVQGVGFRPTVHRVATQLGMDGYVQNNGSNVVIEVDGDADLFLSELRRTLPPLARLDSVEMSPGRPNGELAGTGFQIVKSSSGQKGVGIPNDTAVCENCQKEMFDPSDRRHLYPFTNCTDCGARFSIINDLPYDRELTSMNQFPMCPDCHREYGDPGARRFHHQTISCPVCGPKFRLLDGDGRSVPGEPIPTFASMLVKGFIGVAKGLGRHAPMLHPLNSSPDEAVVPETGETVRHHGPGHRIGHGGTLHRTGTRKSCCYRHTDRSCCCPRRILPSPK